MKIESGLDSHQKGKNLKNVLKLLPLVPRRATDLCTIMVKEGEARTQTDTLLAPAMIFFA